MTPAQVAVNLICGVGHGAFRARGLDTLRKRLVEGHAMLVQMTREDYGYDLARWHEFLRTNRTGGYTWLRKDIDLPRIMKDALANDRWHEAVAEVEGRSRSMPTDSAASKT